MLYHYECLKCHQQVEEFHPANGTPLKKAICLDCSERTLRERVGAALTFGLGAIFLCTLPFWARPASSQAPAVPKDHLAGQAAFRIKRQGDSVVMQALTPPVFKLALINGPRPSSESEVSICTVWNREVRRSYEDMTIVNLTVLKCGPTEYGVAEVNFGLDHAEKTVSK